jgi:hypothetical protein
LSPSAQVDADCAVINQLPQFDRAGGLSQAIVYSTGGVAADGNGFFHALGDHAQASFLIDNQPISDQQSKLFSTQLPTSAIQSMEVTTGTPGAEFGNKTGLVAQITTRSGLNAGRPFGSITSQYGSFVTAGGDVSLGFGTARFGNFVAIDGVRTSHFVDTPEFTPFHDIGNNESIFDRFDLQPDAKDIFTSIFFWRAVGFNFRTITTRWPAGRTSTSACSPGTSRLDTSALPAPPHC